jgi:hypothetical protein
MQKPNFLGWCPLVGRRDGSKARRQGRAGVPVPGRYAPLSFALVDWVEQTVCFGFWQLLATKSCCGLPNAQLFSQFL